MGWRSKAYRDEFRALRRLAGLCLDCKAESREHSRCLRCRLQMAQAKRKRKGVEYAAGRMVA